MNRNTAGHRASVLSVFFALLLALSPGLRAQEAPVVPATPQQRLDQAVKLYQEHEYQRALSEFQSLYQSDPLVELRYLMGLARMKLRHWRPAIDDLQAYQSGIPDMEPARREEVSRLLAEAKEQDHYQQCLVSKDCGPPPPPARAAAPAKPLYKRWWLWTTIGTVVIAGVVVGSVCGTGHCTQHAPACSLDVPSCQSVP